MNKRIDFSQLALIDDIKGESAEDTLLLREMAQEASSYLLSFAWNKGIKANWLGWGIGGICAVFLFEIIPARDDVDRQLWVIVGDLPPAYLVVDEAPTPLCALGIYLELMQEWIDAVQAGRSTQDCIPVNVPATHKNAASLKQRLEFIRSRILS